MTQYRRVGTPLNVWQFTGQPREQWPDFVANYQAHTVFGLGKVSVTNTGVLLLPTPGESSGQAVNHGDWLVEEGGKIIVARGDYFAAHFEPVEDDGEA